MKKLTLKGVAYCNFTYSTRTLYEALKKTKLWKGKPDGNTGYAFVALSGRQITFVMNESDVVVHEGTQWEHKESLLHSMTWRIEGGEFNPHMLENYANKLSISLGLRRFEQWFGERHLLKAPSPKKV